MTMDVERMLSLTPDSLLALGEKLQALNYRYEVYGLPKRVGDVTFRGYHFVPPASETLLNYMLSWASPGDVVYDAGANIGQYTLPLATTGCKVYAFEPDPTAFDRLTKNVAVNRNVDVEPFRVGLSDEAGQATFYVSSRSTRSSFHRFNAGTADAEVERAETVDVKRIDDLVRKSGFEPPDHLKVDVEGLGLEVLRGARETIERHQPIVYFEPHFVERDGTRDKREDEFTEFFEAFDYELRKFDYPCWICVPGTASERLPPRQPRRVE